MSKVAGRWHHGKTFKWRFRRQHRDRHRTLRPLALPSHSLRCPPVRVNSCSLSCAPPAIAALVLRCFGLAISRNRCESEEPLSSRCCAVLPCVCQSSHPYPSQPLPRFIALTEARPCLCCRAIRFFSPIRSAVPDSSPLHVSSLPAPTTRRRAR